MNEQVRCRECNAPMKPGADGRTMGCAYCGAQMQVAIGADQIANGLELDRGNVDAFMLSLTRALHEGMKERAKLELDGDRLASFELDLDDDRFVVVRERGSVVTRHKKVVRGIALKTTTHAVDRWIGLLAVALAAFANENARVAHVLSQLKGA